MHGLKHLVVLVIESLVQKAEVETRAEDSCSEQGYTIAPKTAAKKSITQ
jgi:hypothetical protein